MFYQDATLRNACVIPHLFIIILQFQNIRPFLDLPSLTPRASLPLIQPWTLPWVPLSKMAHINVNTSISFYFCGYDSWRHFLYYISISCCCLHCIIFLRSMWSSSNIYFGLHSRFVSGNWPCLYYTGMTNRLFSFLSLFYFCLCTYLAILLFRLEKICVQIYNIWAGPQYTTMCGRKAW